TASRGTVVAWPPTVARSWGTGKRSAPAMPASTVTGAAESGTLSVLQKGMRVLHAFSVTEPQLSLTEIAHRVDMHKSTVSRILGQLEHMELVVRLPDSGHFQLGLGLIGLAGPLLANLDVR